MAEDVFKLPQSSYDTVCKVIQAYSQVGDKTGLGTVAKMMGTDNTTVSRNIAFLVSVGLLDGGRDKGPTPAGMRLGRALLFDEASDIAAAWRDVLLPHPLIQRIVAAIRVRGGMDATTLQTQIVYTAGINKTAGTMRGGTAVVEMMKAANLISERDGRFIATSATEMVAPSEDEPARATSIAAVAPVVQRVVETSSTGVTVRIELQIQVNAEPGQLRSLGVEVRGMLEELSNAAREGIEDAPSADELS